MNDSHRLRSVPDGLNDSVLLALLCYIQNPDRHRVRSRGLPCAEFRQNWNSESARRTAARDASNCIAHADWKKVLRSFGNMIVRR